MGEVLGAERADAQDVVAGPDGALLGQAARAHLLDHERAVELLAALDVEAPGHGRVGSLQLYVQNLDYAHCAAV